MPIASPLVPRCEGGRVRRGEEESIYCWGGGGGGGEIGEGRRDQCIAGGGGGGRVRRGEEESTYCWGGGRGS